MRSKAFSQCFAACLALVVAVAAVWTLEAMAPDVEKLGSVPPEVAESPGLSPLQARDAPPIVGSRGAGDMRVFVDPETGSLTSRPVLERRTLGIQAAGEEPEKLIEIPSAHGGFRVDAGQRVWKVLQVVRERDGTAGARCVAAQQSAAP